MLAKNPAAKRSKRPKKISYPLSFRVDAKTLELLEKSAAPSGLSVHEQARLKLLEQLHRDEDRRLMEETQRTRHEVGRLRNDVALTLELLLLNLTQGDPQKIRDWIDVHLREGENKG